MNISNFKNDIKLTYYYMNRLSNTYIYNNIQLYTSILFTYMVFNTFSYEIYYFNMSILNMLYWFGLGVLSTIGLGFGFHTGIFFLFPYIINYYETQPSITILNTIIMCLPKIIIWGLGSAIGELPPYLLALKYDRSNTEIIKNEKIKKILKLLYSKIDCSKNHIRFISILLLSSWPNATFDMCGLMCGYYNIALKDFLIPTMIGKSLIKAPIQSFVVLYLYTHESDYNFASYSPININILFNICFLLLFVFCSVKCIQKTADIQRKYISNK